MATFYAALAYNANHGSGAPGTQTGSSSTSGYKYQFTISSSKPSRTYYTFKGWALSSGASSASYQPGGSITVPCATIDGQTNTTTLYAVWKVNTAYVYYNANGGSGAPSTQSHNAGTRITLSATVPTRSGYRFLGWATSASATTAQYQPNTSQELYTTTTLYAVWELAASTLTVSNGTIGTALSIGINRNNSSYTDTIAYTFGTASGTIATKTSSDSVSWTPPTSLASEIPNASTGTCTLTCTTYNGNTVIGTTTNTITLTVPQSLAPTVSVSYADTIAQCLAWGLLVQSRSKLSFTITASGQQGATIATYSTSVNGTSYNSDTFTTDVLLYNGTNSYSVTVTDSRGKQTVSTGNFSVVAYSNPSLTLTLCDRNDSDPDQVDVAFDFSVASVSSNNDANYRLDYKLKSASIWTNGTVQSLGAYSGSISDFIASLDGGDEYDIRINVIDSFQTASVESEVGVAGNILLNSRHNGGLGLLMKSQADNQLDIGKPTVHHGAVLVQFGSTVASHSASGNYAKVVTFSTDVQVGKNLLNDIDPDVKQAYITGANKLGASSDNRTVIIPINQNTDYTFTWNRVAIEGAASDDTNVLLFSEYPVLGTTVGTSTGVNMGYSPAVRTFNSGSNIYAAIKIANITKTTYQDTLSASQLELGQSSTSHEAYVNPSNINVNAPLTLEYIRSGDSAPSRLTIGFNRDYTLNSFTSDGSVDAYLHNLATATWDLYIGKDNNTDSVEILDMHNPWSNTDMTVEWDDTSISTLPTGAVQADEIPVDLTNNYGDLSGCGQTISNSPSEISMAASTYKTVAQFTLPAGKWIISGCIRWGMNSTGRRWCALATTADANSNVAVLFVDEIKGWSDGSGHAFTKFCSVLSVTASTTYYLNGWQNSGAALAALGRLMAIRIC